MIKVSNTEVFGFNAAIRGMRNPKKSWAKSDSHYCYGTDCEGCPRFEGWGNCRMTFHRHRAPLLLSRRIRNFSPGISYMNAAYIFPKIPRPIPISAPVNRGRHGITVN